MTTSRDRLGIEFISVLGMPPVDYAALAGRLECRNIGIGLAPMLAENPHGYPAWSLRDDVQLRRDFRAALDAHGVSLSLGEVFLAMAGRDIADCARDLDLMRELGVAAVNVLSVDPDRGRTLDQCALFAEMANKRGLRAVIEYMPGMPIGSLAAALEVVRHARAANFGVLVDVMHFFRSGSTPAELAAAPPDQIGYIQLCDVPLVSRHKSYADEARYDRLEPGQGELDLAGFLAAAPANVVVGLETPMLAKAQAGIGAEERLRPGLEVARIMLDGATAG